MEGDDARWARLAWLDVTTTHCLLVVQVKASKELPTGWHCVPDLCVPPLTRHHWVGTICHVNPLRPAVGAHCHGADPPPRPVLL